MTFVGFIAEKKDEAFLKKLLKDFFKNMGEKAMIVAINEESINNVKNIHFDTIIVNRELKGIKDIFKTAKYLILNEDCISIQQFQDMNLTVITYGFGGKCTITTSSIEEDRILICLQRIINNINNIQIEPQEINIKKYKNLENEYLYMILGAIMMIYNKKI